MVHLTQIALNCTPNHARVKTMAYLSIAQAAKQAGVDRTTITRKIKAGQISVVKLANDQRGIDPAELERVYPSERPRAQARTATTPQPAVVHNVESTVGVQQIQAYVVLLERLLTQAQEREERLLRILEGRLLPPPKKAKPKKDKKRKR